jgi:nodulation protein E
VLGEGAGILVLEAITHAKARSAKILAELCGFGSTSDGTDMLKPQMVGAVEAMRLALEDARLSPSDIDYVNAHGTGIVANDCIETAAIKRTFGPHAGELAVSSTKSMYGHPLGAGSAMEAVVCIKAIAEGWVPPTLGLDVARNACDLDYTPNIGRPKALSYAMSNSFSFTGLNAVLVFGRAPA